MQKVDLKTDLQRTPIFCPSEDIFLHINLFHFFKGKVTILEIFFYSHFSHSCVLQLGVFCTSIFTAFFHRQFTIWDVLEYIILTLQFTNYQQFRAYMCYRMSKEIQIIIILFDFFFPFCKVQGESFFRPRGQMKSASETALCVNRQVEPGMHNQSTERQLLISH